MGLRLKFNLVLFVVFLLGLGIVGLLYGIAHASAGFALPLTWAPALVGIVLLVAFYFWERHAGDSAFFPISLFLSRSSNAWSSSRIAGDDPQAVRKTCAAFRGLIRMRRNNSSQACFWVIK